MVTSTTRKTTTRVRPAAKKTTEPIEAAPEIVAPAPKGKPGRKSNAQLQDEVMERLITTPAERGQFIDQLSRTELLEKLVALRNDAGLSQSQLAEKIGSHQPDVGKVETGRVMTVAALQRYVRGLGGKLVISIER